MPWLHFCSILKIIRKRERENTISDFQIFQKTKCSLALATEGFSMTREGKLKCLFWAKGCCGIGVWRDLWCLYSGQSRRRIGFPGCFALTLCSPCTSGKRSHLTDTHTHAESANRKQDSATADKSWGFKEKEISCSFSPLFHLHFTAIKEEGEGGTKWPLRGSGFNYPHTPRERQREMGRETVFEGEKESWCLGKCPKTCQSYICCFISNDMALNMWKCTSKVTDSELSS